jgi:TRAP-type C4-dicarboxylate transport system permease small subunit
MRNFFSIGVIWGDELLRMLVLWIAVAGAVAASRGDKHINIAILDRFLPGKVKPAVDVVIHSFTAVVCGIITWHSVQFVLTSKEFGDVLLGNVPAWLLQLILPLGFGLICYRYALFAVKDTVRWLRGGRSE